MVERKNQANEFKRKDVASKNGSGLELKKTRWYIGGRAVVKYLVAKAKKSRSLENGDTA